MCSRIAARRESRACETVSSLARSDAASALACCSSQLRTFGSASNVVSSWICFGDASSFVDAFVDLGVVAAIAPDNRQPKTTMTVRQRHKVRISFTPTAEPTTQFIFEEPIAQLRGRSANQPLGNDPLYPHVSRGPISLKRWAGVILKRSTLNSRRSRRSTRSLHRHLHR